jgi:PIN domain
MATVPVLPTPTELWSAARVLGQKCLDRGFLPPAIDLLIAQVCLYHEVPLITFDTHFRQVAEVSLLKVDLVRRESRSIAHRFLSRSWMTCQHGQLGDLTLPASINKPCGRASKCLSSVGIRVICGWFPFSSIRVIRGLSGNAAARDRSPPTPGHHPKVPLFCGKSV